MDYATREETLVVSGLDFVVREQDGNAEQFLFDNERRLYMALPEYWAMLVIRLGDNENVRRKDLLNLRSPDLDQVAIAIYRAGSTDDTIRMAGSCPQCKKPLNIVKDLSTLDFMPIPEGSKGPDPTFELVTRRKTEIVWGYTTGQDEFDQLAAKGFNPSRTVWKAIRAINGKTDITLKDVLALPIADHYDIREDMQDKRCGYDPRIQYEHSCGYEGVANLLTDPSFLLAGIPSATTG